MPEITLRKGMPSVQLTREQFVERFRARFYDPAFDALAAELDKIVAIAWKAYHEYHKSPRTRRAGAASPTRTSSCRSSGSRRAHAIHDAERRQKSRTRPSRILIINGSARSDQTCPGEMSKTYRLAKIARERSRSGARLRGRLPRSVPAHLRVRPRDLSVQGVRLDRDAALPLAVLAATRTTRWARAATG